MSEPLRPAPDPQVLARLKDHGDTLATASLVWHELLYGLYRLGDSSKRRSIARYLEEVVRPTVLLLPYDDQAAAWHAEQRAKLARMGKTTPFVDGQIAAIAKIHSLTLVTNNVRDYANFEDLDVENWHEAS